MCPIITVLKNSCNFKPGKIIVLLYMKRWFHLTFYDAASSYMVEILAFYEFITTILAFILFFVLWQLKLIIFNQYIDLVILEIQIVEFLITFFPRVILILMAIPSIGLIYLFDQEVTKKDVFPVKVTGFQWYWKYEHELYYFFTRLIYQEAIKDNRYYTVGEILKSQLDLRNREYYRYFVTIKKTNLFNKTETRLLDIIGELIIPYQIQTQLVVTSEDVLHSWAIPAIGIKVDAIPGRLNKVNFVPVRLGNFYGQCSEICGAYHRFIPTKLTVLDLEILDNRTDHMTVTTKNSMAYHY